MKILSLSILGTTLCFKKWESFDLFLQNGLSSGYLQRKAIYWVSPCSNNSKNSNGNFFG